VVVAAVGPTCQAILQAYGVQVQVMPDHPKMGPLVLALMRHLDQRRSPSEPSAPEQRMTH
jgi:uroporphyrinogen-III synthase